MDELLNVLLVEILKISLITIVGLAVPLMVQLLRRAGIQVSVEKQAQINSVALLISAEVEEWAAAKIKANLPVNSGDKLERAIEGMLKKIPGLTEAEAKAAISAALPQIGLGAAAALKELGKGQ